MNNIAVPAPQNTNTTASDNSAWSRGPPPTSPQSQAASTRTNGNGADFSAPVGINGHSRKGSLMVGGGMDIKRGSIAFGTVDSPNPLLSSSPVAPSMTGTHLADNVKAFGSIDADATTDPNAVKATRRASALSPNQAPRRPLDVHALFGKPQPAPMQPSLSSNGSYDHFRPPQPNGTPRSPVGPGMPSYNGQVIQQGFRPGMMPNGQAPRPNMQQGIPQMPQGMPRMMSYGLHPPQGQYMMGYPQQYYDPYQPPFGGQPQWAPQQHPANMNLPLSPAAPSPQPPSNALPNSGGPSPVPTPPSRPGSLMTSQPPPTIPSTPSRPIATPSFTPAQNNFSMSGGAIAFTPRAKSSAIKFSRPDGTAVDIKEVAQTVKGPTPSPSVVGTPDLSETPSVEPPKKKVPTLPVVVRLESEEQKRVRLDDEARQERIRKEEEAEEIDRKERKERKEKAAREEQERQAREAEETEQALQKAEAARTLEAERNALEQAEEAKRQAQVAEAEAEKQAEQKRADQVAKQEAEALRTSTPASPLGSPAISAAGLPPKPIAAGSALRRPVPSALEIHSPARSEDTPMVPVSALTTARPIEDIASIVYPGTLKSPKPQLNIDSEPGKFRYDREFLMQFMNVCREKPDDLPNLEEIGLEADSSSGFGTTRSQRGSRNSTGPSSRSQPPTGLGIGGLGRPAFPAQGMGTFGMGNFSSGSIRGTTSEERYKQSVSQNRLIRTPSQGGPSFPGMSGLPAMAQSTSRGGPRSQRGLKRPPQDRSSFQTDPDVAPLVVSNNAWVKARPSGDDETSPAYVERKVKALLNKLTAEKFDSIAKQLLDWANKSQFETDGITLKLAIKQIFEKATDEAHWSAMYARLCRLLLDQLDPAITEMLDGKPVAGGMLFRKYLVGRCQIDFEAGWKAREDAATAAAAKSEEDKEKLAQQEKQKDEGGESVMMSEEYYIAQKAKRRGLGLVQLIGELFKLEMIGRTVIKTCFVKLLGNLDNPDEEDIESACKLLTTVGKPFEQASQENMDIVFDRLNTVLKNDNLPSRIRFMLMDVIELRRNEWLSRNKQAGVMTIAEIHQHAAREQAQKSAAAAQSTRDSISRGGSRAGHARREPGEWQAVAPSSVRPLQRPTDFSGIGRNLSSSTMPSAPTFGPSSVFTKKKGLPGATPPLSRQTSTVNMFSALEAEPTVADTSTDAPQRKKLSLAPRTVPIPGQEGEDQAEESGEEATASEDEVATPVETSMSETAVKAKIDSDMKELWGEKDAGGSRNPQDIVEYFRALPEERRGMLSERLVEDVFRIAKPKDAEVVSKGWKASLEEGVANVDNLKRGIEVRMPSLDDDAIDFPQAYRAVAILMRSISLSEEDVDALVKKIEVYGEPKVTPKMKLDRALATIDEESAQA